MRIQYTITGINTGHRCEASVIRIGRDPGADIRFEDEFVSRSHAAIREESGRLILEDLGSDNGTFVNGRQISGLTAIGLGDCIRFGNPGPEIRIDSLELSGTGSAGDSSAAAGALPPAIEPPPFVPMPEWGAPAGPPVAVRPPAHHVESTGHGSDKVSWQCPAWFASIAFAVIAAFLALGFLFLHNDGNLSRLFQKVDAATVKIYAAGNDGQQATGSGFFVDPRGWVVTNFHVVAGAVGVEVEMHDGARRAVEGVIADSPVDDLAILKIAPPAGGIQVLPLCAAIEVPPVGTQVCAVGFPLGLKKSLLAGTVSSHMSGREFRHWLNEQGAEADNPLIGLHLRDNMTWIQTDAAVLKGNSGGPLLNRRGEVLGVTTWGLSDHSLGSINFASAAKHLKRLIEDADGRVRPLADLSLGETN